MFCIIGDGESDEGQIWEAAMFAAHHGLDNLTVVCDYNKLQIDGFTHEILNLEPLADKWRAFGWTVRTVDGHNYTELTAVLSAPAEARTPTCFIANTVKGKGVSFMENVAKWHHGVPNDAELQQALAELEAAEAELLEAK